MFCCFSICQNFKDFFSKFLTRTTMIYFTCVYSSFLAKIDPITFWSYFCKNFRKTFSSDAFIFTEKKVVVLLTHFSPVSHFYTPWKRQKTFGFSVTFLYSLKTSENLWFQCHIFIPPENVRKPLVSVSHFYTPWRGDRNVTLKPKVFWCFQGV